MSSSDVFICKTCNKERTREQFSPHKGCKLGIDTSRCKPCKKAKHDWHTTPLNKRIYNRLKRRAKDKNIEFTLDLEDIVIEDICPVFKKPFIYGDTDWTYSVDRKDPNKGYTKENISIISNKANRAKNNLTVKEMYEVIKYMEQCEVTF